MNIKWSVFEDNSSELDTLVEFSKGRSISHLRKWSYTRETIREVNRIKQLNIGVARRRAKRWLHENGYIE